MEIRLLQENDLSTRVEWMNDSRINSTLNIQLPVTIESTQSWFNKVNSDDSRRDFSFVENGQVVAMGGLTSIDTNDGKAELYIFVSPELKGKGIGTKSVRLLCEHGFNVIKLNKIYLNANADNIAACRLYEKLGFQMDGYTPHEIINNGKVKDRCHYSLYNTLNNKNI